MAEFVDTVPLLGDKVYSLKVSTTDGPRVLAHRWYALEMGHYKRVHTAPEPDYPGVNVIDLFDAYHPASGEPPTLDEAIERSPDPQRFLLSLAHPSFAVVTSRIGYTEEGTVDVLPGGSGRPELNVDWYDCHEAFRDEDLTSMHIGRVSLHGGDPLSPLPQETADQAFRQMMYRAPERH
ncbi:MAG TPA: hypothetical protein VK674_04015 [Candidatus Limnocylindria bacterium]|nr:hypothetical protein [Candidatus Limnocylindria bacterium]